MFMRFGPDIPLKRMMNEQLVERPIFWLSKQQRHDFIYLIIICALLFGGGELLLMFGPEFMIGYAADLALYLDIVGASYLTIAVTNLKAAVQATRARLAGWHSLVFRLGRMVTCARAPRRHSGTNRADNDDDHSRPVLQMAA